MRVVTGRANGPARYYVIYSHLRQRKRQCGRSKSVCVFVSVRGENNTEKSCRGRTWMKCSGLIAYSMGNKSSQQ